MSEININVVGASASGKTTILKIIELELLKHGFNVDFNNNFDYDTDEFKKFNDEYFNEKIKSVSKKSNIVLKEVQKIKTLVRE